MPGRFIALEGPDGVGKTTLAEQLGDITYDTAITDLAVTATECSEPSAGRPLVFVSRRQVSGTAPYSARLMEHLATMLWHSGDSPDLPDAFWVPVQAAWFTAHATTVLEPLLVAGHDVIVDGWIYKFCSKLLVQGYPQAELDTVFGRVRRPDAVVLLTADIAALFDRRPRFRPAELGMHLGYPDLGRQSFVDYQQQGLNHLVAFAQRGGWHTVHLDPTTTVEDTVAVLRPRIAQLRAAGPAMPVRTGP